MIILSREKLFLLSSLVAEETQILLHASLSFFFSSLSLSTAAAFFIFVSVFGCHTHEETEGIKGGVEGDGKEKEREEEAAAHDPDLGGNLTLGFRGY